MKEGWDNRPVKPFQGTSRSASAKGSASMKRFLLFIRGDGCNNIATIHPDEALARADLAIYVRQQNGVPVFGDTIDDEDAIRTHFACGTAMYVVARVASLAR